GRPPAGEVELALAAAAGELLGVPGIGADDDFFALGGDSISAIRLVGRLRRQGWALSVRQVFELRTVAALAAAAEPVAPAPTAAPSTAALVSLDDSQRDRLEALVRRRRR
ncbi:acyl carrier protein, partial [Kineococcus glutinatus]|uniref:acyl carrier protein n=1 Tax=Kineococcus glutinatus TaxID=1070872 RepID=UPI0031EA0D3A